MLCPFPQYWMCHIAVALTIAAALWPLVGLLGGLAAGTAFYAGREFTQWQSGLPFDWKGLLAPAVTCLIIGVLAWL